MGVKKFSLGMTNGEFYSLPLNVRLALLERVNHINRKRLQDFKKEEEERKKEIKRKKNIERVKRKQKIREKEKEKNKIKEEEIVRSLIPGTPTFDKLVGKRDRKRARENRQKDEEIIDNLANEINYSKKRREAGYRHQDILTDIRNGDHIEELGGNYYLKNDYDDIAHESTIGTYSKRKTYTTGIKPEREISDYEKEFFNLTQEQSKNEVTFGTELSEASKNYYLRNKEFISKELSAIENETNWALYRLNESSYAILSEIMWFKSTFDSINIRGDLDTDFDYKKNFIGYNLHLREHDIDHNFLLLNKENEEVIDFFNNYIKLRTFKEEEEHLKERKVRRDEREYLEKMDKHKENTRFKKAPNDEDEELEQLAKPNIRDSGYNYIDYVRFVEDIVYSNGVFDSLRKETQNMFKKYFTNQSINTKIFADEFLNFYLGDKDAAFKDPLKIRFDNIASDYNRTLDQQKLLQQLDEFRDDLIREIVKKNVRKLHKYLEKEAKKFGREYKRKDLTEKKMEALKKSAEKHKLIKIIDNTKERLTNPYRYFNYIAEDLEEELKNLAAENYVLYNQDINEEYGAYSGRKTKAELDLPDYDAHKMYINQELKDAKEKQIAEAKTILFRNMEQRNIKESEYNEYTKKRKRHNSKFNTVSKISKKIENNELFRTGNIGVFDNFIVGITGGRKASEESKSWIEDQINKLPENTAVMVGLAEGIDTTAAVAAINRGLPVIAVLPHGLNRNIFPQSNEKLAKQIVDNGGVLISEYPDSKSKKSPFPKKNFVERDRIIADADKLIAAEGGRGTQHTINFAKEFGTPIIQYNKDEYLRYQKDNQKQPVKPKEHWEQIKEIEEELKKKRKQESKEHWKQIKKIKEEKGS